MAEQQQRQAGPGCLVLLAVVLGAMGLYALSLGYGGFQVVVFGLLLLVGAVVLVLQAWRQKGEQIANEENGRRPDRADQDERPEE